MVFGLLAAFATQAAVVYKWTDADGVVHFSDQPAPGAEKINTDGSAAHSGTSFGANSPTPAKAPDKKSATSPQAYTEFAIGSPTPDQTFTGNAPVNAHLNLDPALMAHHAVTWYLNGKPVEDQSPDATSITLNDLARGSYVIAASVIDQDSGESRTTDSVNFYVRQPSLLSPQHK
jgi:hypothetical protein